MACFQSISNEKPPLNTHWKLFSLETSLVFQKQCTWKVAAQHNLCQDYQTTPWPSSTGLWKKGWLGGTTKNLQDQTGWRKGSLSSWQKAPNNLLLADGNTGAEPNERLETVGREPRRTQKPALAAVPHIATASRRRRAIRPNLKPLKPPEPRTDLWGAPLHTMCAFLW